MYDGVKAQKIKTCRGVRLAGHTWTAAPKSMRECGNRAYVRVGRTKYTGTAANNGVRPGGQNMGIRGPVKRTPTEPSAQQCERKKRWLRAPTRTGLGREDASWRVAGRGGTSTTKSVTEQAAAQVRSNRPHPKGGDAAWSAMMCSSTGPAVLRVGGPGTRVQRRLEQPKKTQRKTPTWTTNLGSRGT